VAVVVLKDILEEVPMMYMVLVAVEATAQQAALPELALEVLE
jgi:hypothetical protein